MAITAPLLAACLIGFALLPHDHLLDPLTFVLAGVAFAAHILAVDIGGPIILGGAFVAFIVAIAFLGPAPAFAISTVAEIGAWAYERYRPAAFLLNVVGSGAPNLAAGATFAAFHSSPADTPFYALLAVVSAATITGNALLVTWLSGVLHGVPARTQLRNHLAHAPGIVVSIGIALGASLIYAREGLTGAAFVLVAIPIFGYMTRQVLLAREHASRISDLASDRRRLATEVFEAGERERRQLADRLHDGPVQALLAARQEVAAQRVRGKSDLITAQGAIEETVAQLRHAIFELHPAVLEAAGLQAAVRAFVDHHSESAGFQADIDIEPSTLGIADHLLFSLIREFVVNAARHAKAQRVSIALRRHAESLVLIVSDDGVGFHPSAQSAAVRRGHIGLASAIERVETAGGHLSIHADVGKGTIIRAELPAPEAASAERTLSQQRL